MRPKTRTWLFVGVGLLLALVVVNAGTEYRQTKELHEDAAWVSHTHQVIAALDELLSTVKDAETGQRGYVITDNKDFLQPYNSALSNYEGQIERVAALTADNPRQQARMGRLKELVAARLTILARVVAELNTTGFEAARQDVAMGDGQKAMHALRNFVAEMQRDERPCWRSASR